MANPFRAAAQATADYAAAKGWIRSPVRLRAYKGAEMGRLTASWDTVPLPADAEVRRALRPLRARSREMARNSGYMVRFLSLLSSNVVGPVGVTVQARVTTGQGSTKMRTGVNDAIEKAFRDWGRVCDHAGELEWLDMQGLAIQAIAEDGEILIEKIIDPDSPWGCSVMLLDPELLDVDLNQDKRDGSRIKMGIDYGPDGRRRGYWLRTSTDNGYSSHMIGGKPYRYVRASMMIHAFIRKRVGQSRGVPWAHPIMWRHHQQDGYEDAAVTAARVGASKMGFFKNATGQQYTGDKVDGKGRPVIDAADPGSFEVLPEGMSFEQFNPDYPHSQFSAFTTQMLRGISAGLGVSYHSLANDLSGVNFSSIRAGVLEDRECWKALQTWFIRTIVEQVYRFFLEMAIANRAIVVNGTPLDARRLDQYMAAIFQGRRWAWVDPLKDIKANADAYALGTTSISAIIRDTGRDPEDVWRERQREQDTMAQYGITVVVAGAPMPDDEPQPEAVTDGED